MLTFEANPVVPIPNNPNIWPKIVFMSEPLNIMKLIATITKTSMCLINAGIFSITFLKIVFSKISNTPNSNPHITKFHAAPCHKPVRAHTIKIFLIYFILDTLFPPSGIYT